MAEGNGSTGNGTITRWAPIVVAAVTILSAIVGGTFWLSAVSSQAQTANARVADMQSRLDRIAAEEDHDRTEITEMRSALTEIETQFRASDQVRNLMHANDMRIAAMLWAKAFPGSTLPTDNAYYPTIARPDGGLEK